MSQSTEKIFHKLDAYLSEHESEIKNEKDYKKHIEIFMQKYNQSLKDGTIRLCQEFCVSYAIILW